MEPDDPQSGATFSGAERAAEALAALADGPGVQAARALETAFENAGQAIENSLVKAARSGELSFAQMTEAVLQSLARIAIEGAVDAAFSGVLEAITAGAGSAFFGARATGGFVAPGGAYLVGEGGPEVFTPTSAGRVDPLGASAPVVVNFNLSSGADSAQLRRSEGQIAAIVARAAARGRRML